MDTQNMTVGAMVLASGSIALAESVSVHWNSEYIAQDVVRVWADLTIDPGADFVGFANTIFDVIGDDTHAGTISHEEAQGLGRRFQFDGSNAGDVSGDDIAFIEQFQLPENLTGDYDGASTFNEFFVFEYTITDFTERTVSFTSDHRYFAMYTDGWGTNVDYTWSVYGTSFDVAVVPLPTPAAAAMAGLVGLVFVRRARA